MGAAAVGAGRWIRSRGLDTYGLTVLSIAVGRLLLLDWWRCAFHAPWSAHQFKLVINTWTILMVAASAAWWAAATLLMLPRLSGAGEPYPRRSLWRTTGECAAAVAMALLGGSLVMKGADAGSVCLAWLVLALISQAIGQRIVALPLVAFALFTLALATSGIAVISPMNGDSSGGTVVLGIVFTRWLWLMLAGAGAWWGATLLLMWGPGAAEWARTPGFKVHTLFQAGEIGALLLMGAAFVHRSVDFGALGIVWIFLALASLILARVANTPAVRIFAFLPLAAASLAVVFTAPFVEFHPATRLDWMFLMVLTAAGWAAAAALLPRTTPDPRPGAPALVEPAAIVAGISTIVLYTAFLHPRVTPTALCLTWTGLAAVILILHSLLRRLALDFTGFLGLAAAAGAWAVKFPLDWRTSTAPALAHPGLWVSAAIATIGFVGVWWIGSRRHPARPTAPDLLPWIAAAAGALLFISTSLEVSRSAERLTSDPTTHRAAATIWWGIVAVGLVVGGFLKPLPHVRYVGLALLAAATGKAMVWDLAQVPQVWRIASFIGLGLLMLGVAVGYSSLSRFQKTTPPQ
jgi:hypothetical protein